MRLPDAYWAWYRNDLDFRFALSLIVYGAALVGAGAYLAWKLLLEDAVDGWRDRHQKDHFTKLDLRR